MPSSVVESCTTIDQFLHAVGGFTKAADGSTPMSEPGSIGGETEHPVKKVDDRLQTPKEGERFKENTKDVNEDQGKPSVQNAAEAKAGSTNRAATVFDVAAQFAAGSNGHQKHADTVVSRGGSAADDHISTTTKVTATGEDPANETNSAKAGKEDKREGGVGGTDHPANTENNKIDGHKWAADSPLEKLASAMKETGDNLCAQIAWLSQNQGAHSTAQAANQHTTKQAQAPQPEIDPYLAQQLGWEMAGLVNGTFDKKAADSLVVGTLEQIIKTAVDDADRFTNFMDNFLKQAEGEMPPEMPPGGGGMPPPGAGGPPGGPGGAPGGGGADAMMGALGGGADAGGMPPEAGGGAPPGGPGGGGDAEAMQLAHILEQLGVTPEQLEQAMQEEAGGGGGPPGAGGPPPGGGMPPPGAGAPPGMEATASDRGRQKQADSEKFAHARQYISEIVQRSRARKN